MQFNIVEFYAIEILRKQIPLTVVMLSQLKQYGPNFIHKIFDGHMVQCKEKKNQGKFHAFRHWSVRYWQKNTENRTMISI